MSAAVGYWDTVWFCSVASSLLMIAPETVETAKRAAEIEARVNFMFNILFVCKE